MGWLQRINAGLEDRQRTGGWRTRQVNDGGCARHFIHDGKTYLNFSSNDYLGLSHHPSIIEAWQEGAELYGVGSGGSGHVSGYSCPHQQLEQALASWLGFDRALLFISGYSANQAVIGALAKKSDCIIADKLSHASIIEAAIQSPADLRRFHHNDIMSLTTQLEKLCEGERLVITEGVFSMDGDSAPLNEIYQQTSVTNGWLCVDDAHGIGVIGEEGRGSCYQQKIKPDILVVTFGKAFGIGGAAVLCCESTANYFIQFARHLIYSTMMPAAQACALQKALTIIRAGDELRHKLHRNIQLFRQGSASLPFNVIDSHSAIQPLIIGDNQRTLAIAAELKSRGIWLTAIRPPTVAPGSARLRITLSADHTEDDIAQLLETLYDAG